MNRITKQATVTATHAVAVAGPDLDPSLAAKLTQGDKVMIEVNGTRIYSDLKCPVVAERPWTVVSNEPPTLGQRPNEIHKLVISHQSLEHHITLNYCNLLHLTRRQPAVFLERHATLSSNEDGTVNPVYIILQLVSHYMPASQVDSTYEPYDRAAARMVLGDDDFRRSVMVQWVAMFKDFTKPGWGQKSVYRFAQRAFVKPSLIEAFREENWEVIDTLDKQSLHRIHEAIHWLPCFFSLARLDVSRDTSYGENASKAV